MIGHDLIEQVGGIEKARGIVGGAPDVAIHYVSKDVKLNLDDLRSIIADHDSREFKVGDWIISDDGGFPNFEHSIWKLV